MAAQSRTNKRQAVAGVQGPVSILAQAQSDLDEYWDEDFVREYLRLGSSTLRGWRLRKVGPAWTKLGDLVRYKKQDVLDWLQSRRVDPSASTDQRTAADVLADSVLP